MSFKRLTGALLLSSSAMCLLAACSTESSSPGDSMTSMDPTDPINPTIPVHPGNSVGGEGGDGDPILGMGTGGNFSEPSGEIVPLFSEATVLEPLVLEDRGDALVTRLGDRGRDRHAREDEFQAYDHYLKLYWEDRTANIEIIDTIGRGGTTITFNVETQFKLEVNQAELRFFYRGTNTVAEYHNNGVMTPLDDWHYTRSVSRHGATGEPLQVGDLMEFELSQFLDDSVEEKGGRANYYGTTFLYVVGEGLVPWQADQQESNECPCTEEISYPISEEGWLLGRGTLMYQYSNEPRDHFMQMIGNLAGANAQPFVLGRRVIHTNFEDGTHNEDPENPSWPEQAGKLGPLYINQSCDACHAQNTRSLPPPVGERFSQYVFKIGNEEGASHPFAGSVLQSGEALGASEGVVVLKSWFEDGELRRPEYEFTGVVPEAFSARAAPPLVGMGGLEAIPEEAILALADPLDENGDGISGRPRVLEDPVTQEKRLGRFGWKAGQAMVRYQIAGALNTDMGVMTSIFPTPDCGSEQQGCGDEAGAELDDIDLAHLTKYVSLLGVRARRNLDDPIALEGERLFGELGCAGCHTPTFETSPYYPLAELRSQTIHPCSDLLLHDMGQGLADSLPEGDSSGSE